MTEWNELRQRRRCITVHICKFYGDGMQKKRFFSFISCFFLNNFFFFFFPKLLQGLLITWLQAQKHTGVHSPYVNLQTRVQGKQMYVGLHCLVQTLYCNHLVCVCACSQDLKLAVKQALELFTPSSLRSSRTHNFTTCSLFSVSLSLAYTVVSYGCCCSCCNCSTIVEKEEEVITIQEHKKPTSKRNPRNSKPRKIYHFQH
jgi:hypothetical protein